MHSLSLTYLLSLLVIPSLTDDSCFFCASPELDENWEITNFPQKPQGLTFTDKCGSDTNTDLKKTCSQGVCYEAIIPINKRAAYLRGCYADFVEETNYTRQTLSSGPACVYGVNGKDTYLDTNINNPTEKPAYAANRWCTNVGETTMCNKQLKYTADLFNSPATYFTDCKNPGQQQDRQCIECSHFGGDGDCNPDSKTTCRGQYCVKYDGFLNGEVMTVRTCAPTTPFSGDECVWIESSSDFQLFGVTLKLPYKAWHCYCYGDQCNPSSTVSSSLLISIVLPLLLSRFLPFCSSS